MLSDEITWKKLCRHPVPWKLHQKNQFLLGFFWRSLKALTESSIDSSPQTYNTHPLLYDKIAQFNTPTLTLLKFFFTLLKLSQNLLWFFSVLILKNNQIVDYYVFCEQSFFLFYFAAGCFTAMKGHLVTNFFQKNKIRNAFFKINFKKKKFLKRELQPSFFFQCFVACFVALDLKLYFRL